MCFLDNIQNFDMQNNTKYRALNNHQSLWQELELGQLEHPQPQPEHDFPAFLFLRIVIMMNTIMQSNITLIMIVDKLVLKKSII